MERFSLSNETDALVVDTGDHHVCCNVGVDEMIGM